jgi:hypothetical protein
MPSGTWLDLFITITSLMPESDNASDTLYFIALTYYALSNMTLSTIFLLPARFCFHFLLAAI